MVIFYFFSAVVIWLGISSLYGGFRFAAYVRRETSQPVPDFTPFVSLLLPCRGVDQGFDENLRSVFRQEYPHYQIVFVTDSAGDPALGVIEQVTREQQSGRVAFKVVIAGAASDSGQKVHNLRLAVTEIEAQSEVLAFVDADARPGPNWLRQLVAPLQDEQIGATTGYRWFVSRWGGLASQLLSVWNASIASALGERSDKNFCWGGSTAIRRSTFDTLHLRERWRGTVSDDFTVMQVMREAGLAIKFVPACLTASFDDYNFRQLLEFTTRQLQITRVYAPEFWRAALAGGVIFNSVFFGGLVLVAIRAASGLSYSLPLALLGIVFLLGAAKSFVRWRAVGIPLADYRHQLRKGLPAHLLLWPLTALLFFYNAIAAGLSRRISWRGIIYELNSPTKAVIISRKP